MPYSIGPKGSYGCSGYPVVKDGTSEVMGCHDSMQAAQTQIAAINMSETEKGKKKMTSALGQPEPASYGKSNFNWSTPVRKPERSTFSIDKNCGCETCKSEGISCKDCKMCSGMDKQAPCWDGYVQRGMKPGEGGGMVPNCVPASKADDLYEDGDDVEYDDDISKADTYTPTSGMKSAARRALKWKEDGKATGAGTAVGWGRASDIVAGRAMSLSTVKRMFSFFSRHEVDKKGKDFNNTSNPSNGRIMWDAWGGDAGFSWSRQIAERERNKMFENVFGKDAAKRAILEKAAKAQSMMSQRAEQAEVDIKGYRDKGYKEEKADSVRVGQMVSWNSSGGTARGKVKRIISNGSYNVPGTEVTVTGTPEAPAAVITLYRDGKATDTIVAHKVKTLRAS